MLQKKSTKYPILLVHGFGYRDNKIINYWGRIPSMLEKQGCKIFYGNQEANATIEVNGKCLASEISKIIAEENVEKVNVIAHSKGGLDIRYAISTLGIGDKVASVTTISTPHHGSKTVDFLLKFPDAIVRIVAFFADLMVRIWGDKTPDSYNTFYSLTTKKAREFNEDNPDDINVYYQSYAFIMKNAFSDIFLFLPHFVVKCIEGENDGLLTSESVRWGEYKGVYRGTTNRGISHCDEVDMRRREFSKKKSDNKYKVSNIIDFYSEIVSELAERGF